MATEQEVIEFLERRERHWREEDDKHQIIGAARAKQLSAFIQSIMAARKHKDVPVYENDIYLAILKGETKAYISTLGTTEQDLATLTNRGYTITRIKEEYFSGWEVNWSHL